MSKASNSPTGSAPFHPQHQSDAANRDLLYDGNNLPYNPDLIPYARDLRKNATQTERMLWNYLKTLPERVLRQPPIDHYIVDFYVPSKKLVMESTVVNTTANRGSNTTTNAPKYWRGTG